jgi:hypothetical protein
MRRRGLVLIPTKLLVAGELLRCQQSAGFEMRYQMHRTQAAVAAGSPTRFWRMSGHPAVQQALRNSSFDALGLPRLYVPAPA